MNVSTIIKPTKDLVQAVKDKTDLLPNPPLNVFSNNYDCYPGAANAVSVDSGLTAWVWGDWVELIAADVVTADFLIIGGLFTHYLVQGKVDSLFEVGVGASESESGIIQIPLFFFYESEAGWSEASPVFFWPRKVAANSRISVRLACSHESKSERVKIIITEL